jgi:hypothetical protein
MPTTATRKHRFRRLRRAATALYLPHSPPIWPTSPRKWRQGPQEKEEEKHANPSN